MREAGAVLCVYAAGCGPRRPFDEALRLSRLDEIETGREAAAHLRAWHEEATR